MPDNRDSLPSLREGVLPPSYVGEVEHLLTPLPQGQGREVLIAPHLHKTITI